MSRILRKKGSCVFLVFDILLMMALQQNYTQPQHGEVDLVALTLTSAVQ